MNAITYREAEGRKGHAMSIGNPVWMHQSKHCKAQRKMIQHKRMEEGKSGRMAQAKRRQQPAVFHDSESVDRKTNLRTE